MALSVPLCERMVTVNNPSCGKLSQIGQAQLLKMVPVSPGHLSYSTIVHGDTLWSCRSWTVSLKAEQKQGRGQGRYVEVLTLWDLWKSPNVEVESATINLQCQLDWIESHLGEIPLTYLWRYIESTSQKWKTLLHVSRLIPWSWILSWFFVF